jgi:hypothetical protein
MYPLGIKQKPEEGTRVDVFKTVKNYNNNNIKN